MQSTEVLFRLAGVRADRVVLSPVNLPRSVASLSREEKAARLQRLVAREARLAAEKVDLALAMAADSRADSPDGEVSEFFADEFALVLNCSRAAATTLYGQARVLAERLPATFAALRAGELDWPRARAMATELGEPADDTDPAIVAAERRRKLADRSVNVGVRRTGDGMAELFSGHRADRAAAMFDAIDRYAWLAKKAGDQRPINVIRAEVHEALVLRPWQNAPTVTARLDLAVPLSALRPTVPAPGQPAPTATVNGMPITAAHLRALLTELGAYHLCAPAGGQLHLALYDDDGRLRAALTPGELATLVKRGCPEHGAGDCGCAVLDLPPAVDRYRPTPAQRRFVSTRDRTCRWPGCANPAGWADHDHVIAHGDGGPTDCCNLCCLCRHHHQIKTKNRHWRFVMDDDGTLHVTTPSGVTRTTRPPGFDVPGLDPPDRAGGGEAAAESGEDAQPF